jgi:hypothetical protein
LFIKPYSTSSGTSLDRQSLTVSDRPLALQKFVRYLSEKVRETGSVRSISIEFSGFSTLLLCLSWTDPEPMSPWQENLTPSFVHSIETACVSRLHMQSLTQYPPDSDRALRSLQMRWNSAAGMVMVAA